LKHQANVITSGTITQTAQSHLETMGNSLTCLNTVTKNMIKSEDTQQTWRSYLQTLRKEHDYICRH